ncbi:uncharacterized protein LOC130630244 isoform X2 [Hydractinia symbiolongicarpus]|uniref:uncharacterized protein LOC130630244 isoform X2 n=1 Tax=Hydractinia symbiolongicarpus TaxID=13093 RepID=UPI00254B96D0|nr:uncharacterized protein LOC130630244 isoform X2 [Hydractinia symbiolongicarpus]
MNLSTENLHLLDAVKCSYCSQTLEEPKILDCNDTFCKECLDGLLVFRHNGSATIQCPEELCEEETSLESSETTNSLATNHNMSAVVKSLSHENTKYLCEESSNCKSSVTRSCTKCQTNTCDDCWLSHDCVDADYTPIIFHRRAQTILPFCTSHRSIANVICSDCDGAYICRYCQHRTHVGHKSDTIQTEAGKIKHSLLKQVEDGEKKRQRAKILIQGCHKQIDDIKMSMDEFSTELDRRVQTRLSKYFTFLEDEKKRILDEWQHFVNRLKAEVEIFDESSKVSNVISRYFEKVKSKGDYFIVAGKVNIAERLKSLIPQNVPQMQAVLKDVEDNTFECNPLGKLSVTFQEIPLNDSLNQYVRWEKTASENLKKVLLRSSAKGTFKARFKPVTSTESTVKARFQCIQPMDEYKHFSVEELRLQDYNIFNLSKILKSDIPFLKQKTRFGYPNIASSSATALTSFDFTGFGFTSAPTFGTAGAFGAGSSFGSTGSSTFGSTNAPSPFTTRAPTFGTAGAFGVGSSFGSIGGSSTFGSTNPPNPFTTRAPTFGTAGAFGVGSSFGSTGSSTLGSTNAPNHFTTRALTFGTTGASGFDSSFWSPFNTPGAFTSDSTRMSSRTSTTARKLDNIDVKSYDSFFEFGKTAPTTDNFYFQDISKLSGNSNPQLPTAENVKSSEVDMLQYDDSSFLDSDFLKCSYPYVEMLAAISGFHCRDEFLLFETGRQLFSWKLLLIAALSIST